MGRRHITTHFFLKRYISHPFWWIIYKKNHIAMSFSYTFTIVYYSGLNDFMGISEGIKITVLDMNTLDSCCLEYQQITVLAHSFVTHTVVFFSLCCTWLCLFKRTLDLRLSFFSWHPSYILEIVHQVFINKTSEKNRDGWIDDITSRLI